MAIMIANTVAKSHRTCEQACMMQGIWCCCCHNRAQYCTSFCIATVCWSSNLTGTEQPTLHHSLVAATLPSKAASALYQTHTRCRRSTAPPLLRHSRTTGRLFARLHLLLLDVRTLDHARKRQCNECVQLLLLPGGKGCFHRCCLLLCVVHRPPAPSWALQCGIGGSHCGATCVAPYGSVVG
jgi:hypothetical protein